MALAQSFSTPAGLVCNSAYIRIDRVITSKLSSVIDVGFYSNSDLPPFHTITLNTVPLLNEVNVLQQAYEHLKTLPEFADATDC